MLTATGSQLILDVLRMFQDQDRVFTAYDVTVIVRTRTSENIHHSDVQSMVHDQWLTDEFDDHYLRDDMVQLDVVNKPYAIVYYPDIKDSSDHPLAINSPAPASSAPQIQPQPTPYAHPLSSHPTTNSTPGTAKLGGATKQTDGSYVCKLTSEGRVNIPRTMVDKVDNSGGSVDITINGSLVNRTPNDDGRIRVNLLSKGFNVGDSVNVELTANNASITIGHIS